MAFGDLLFDEDAAADDAVADVVADGAAALQPCLFFDLFELRPCDIAFEDVRLAHLNNGIGWLSSYVLEKGESIQSEDIKRAGLKLYTGSTFNRQ